VVRIGTGIEGSVKVAVQSVRSLDGAQRNPGIVSADAKIPDCAALHPGYEALEKR
jgi:hypothetical protein